jgi:hypothetical protein
MLPNCALAAGIAITLGTIFGTLADALGEALVDVDCSDGVDFVHANTKASANHAWRIIAF